MDAPPTNYNPNDSMLSGGTESIMKVMGGGSVEEGSIEGGGAPPGYNETQSVLSGGIDSPIVKVVGGGPGDPTELTEPLKGSKPSAPLQEVSANDMDISIRYVNHYELEPQALALYNQKIPTDISEIQADITKNENEINEKDVKFRKKIYHYKLSGNILIPDTLSDNIKDAKTEIKFIPKNTREIIVLPPVDGNPYTFFKQIAFLKDSKYMYDDGNLQNNIFVVSLKPFYKENTGEVRPEIVDSNEGVTNPNPSGGAIQKNDLLKSYYLNMKNINYDSFYIINEPYKIIYPKKIGTKEGIFFTSKGEKEFFKPENRKNELNPTNIEEINEFNILSMGYKNNDSGSKFGENDFYLISNGDIDVDIYNTNPTFELSKHIAILEVSDNDVPIVVVDINGETYRVRVPSDFNSSIYKGWKGNQFTKHERKLVDDLRIKEMLQKENNINGNYVADFLYYLVTFKCFNDVSLLTNNECNFIRDALKKLYKFNLTRKMSKMDLYKSNNLHYKNTNINCLSAGVGDQGMITCEIHTNTRGITKAGTVQINKPNEWNGRVTDKMKQEAFNKWIQQKM